MKISKEKLKVERKNNVKKICLNIGKINGESKKVKNLGKD